MSEVKRFKPVINDKPYKPYAHCEESEDGIYVRLSDYAELKAQRDALAAESAMLKSGIGFFSYGSDGGFEEHDSAEKAIAAAEADIDYYRGDACDGWSEETDQTIWGVIMQRATMIDERPNSEELPYGSCDFALLPKLATPDTDTYLNSVRAEGVDYFAEAIGAKGAELKVGSKDWKALKSIVFTLVDFAARLRAGEPS